MYRKAVSKGVNSMSSKDTPMYQQLVSARAGSEPELASIIARFMPNIRRFARKYSGPGLDFEDAVQEGIIGLFSAIQKFSFTEDTPFTPYASACIHNAIITAKRNSLRKKHALLNNSVQIPPEQSVPGPEEAADVKEQLFTIWEKVGTILSPLERRVLSLHLKGLSYEEIGKLIGKSGKAADNALGRLRRKLR